MMSKAMINSEIYRKEDLPREIAEQVETIVAQQDSTADANGVEAQVANLRITGAILSERAKRVALYGEKWDKNAEMRQILQALKKLGNQLRELRKQHNMRRCELAEMVDVSEEQINLAEQGLLDRCETIELILAIAEGLPDRTYSEELISQVAACPPILMDRFREKMEALRQEKRNCTTSFQELEHVLHSSPATVRYDCDIQKHVAVKNQDDCRESDYIQLSLFQ